MAQSARQLFWCSVIAAALFGCEQEPPIVQHRIPKAKPLPSEELALHSKKTRILGVILPEKDHTWFFKLMGPEPTVKAEAENFNKLLESVKINEAATAGSPIQFTPPAGWKSQGASQMAMINYAMGPADQMAKFTVTQLEGPAGGVLENINRWRHTQLGLPPVTEAELPNITSLVTIDGRRGYMADFTGAGSAGSGSSAGGASMMPMTGPMPAAPAGGATGRGTPPKFVMPDAWKPDAGSSMSVAAFAAGDAKVTLTPIAGDGGGALGNVNRWRGQVGLEPLDQAGLDREKAALMVDGAPAVYVDLAGPVNRMLGVILNRDGHAWFVKMLGPAATVGSQKAAFESFVTSLQFSGDPGAGK